MSKKIVEGDKSEAAESRDEERMQLEEQIRRAEARLAELSEKSR